MNGYSTRKAGPYKFIERLSIPAPCLGVMTVILLFLTTPLCAKNRDLDDSRGPVAAYAGRVQVDDEGVRISGFVQPSSGPNDVWSPTWISAPAPQTQASQAIQFRREFTLDAPVAVATTWISADPHYHFWVNGVLVSRGPDDPGNDYRPHDRWSHRWLADQVDVERFLHPGVNTLAVEIYPEHRGSFTLGPSALAFKLVVELLSPGSKALVIESGSAWMTRTANSYRRGPKGMVYDARLDSGNWRDAGGESSAWSPAKQIESVWGPVAISELPPMMEAIWPIQRIVDLQGRPMTSDVSMGTPLDAEHTFILPGDGGFRVDYDRVLSAYVSLEVEGPTGATVTVTPKESKTGGRAAQPFQITLGQGVTRFESPVLDSFSTIEFTVKDATAPVVFRDVRASFVSQPVAYRGSFTSSDQVLNGLWRASRWQTQLCMQSRWLDSPDHQEPIGDPGDYLIEAEVANYAFGPVPLTHQFLKEFALILDNWEKDHPSGAVNFHTSYSLLWLQTLLEDFEATGDPALARELAPSAYRLLDRFAHWVGPNGLISEAPNYLFMDWVKIAGFNAHHPPAVIGQGYLTAFYYRGLKDGLRLARLRGDNARAAQYGKQLVDLRQAFNRELWDADAGLYRDGKPFLNHNPTSDPNMLPPDRDVVTHSAQVNVLAVLYDLAPRKRDSQIMARVLEASAAAPQRQNTVLATAAGPLDSLNVQPYFMHFVFAAEAHAGVLGKYAAQQLARWRINPETRTFQEMWGTGDWSHGWGSTPLLQMSAHVLGVASASPGFRNVTLAPIPLNLTFAKGVVPTSQGDVAVSWERDKNQFIYKVVLPGSITGTLDLTDVEGALGASVSIDGHPRMTYRRPFAIATGSHAVVVRLTP